MGEYVSTASRWGKQWARLAVAGGEPRAYDIGMTRLSDSLDTHRPGRTAVLVGISAAFVLLAPTPALSAPMRCSGEEKTCIANCKKSLDRSSISTCLTNCGLRQSACMKSGCWDSGPQRYCGLLKQ
jgi:hypothetical protein